MAIPNRVLKKMTNTKLKLSDLNPHLMCVLCGGYYIDATTIVECLHSFCRSCIVKHLEGSKYCPICEVQVHKTKPLINIRPDKTLQDIVYKLVPGLFANEMQNRRVFYQERPHYIKPDDSESVGEVSGEQKIFVNGDNITFSLIYLDGPSPLPVEDRLKELTTIQSELRYFRCPAGVTIQHLKKLLKAKYELRGNNYRIDIFFKDEVLNDEYTLLDVSYIYLWKTKENLSLTYKIYECPAKRRRRRYFGGVDELPAHYTPLSILQSRLGVLADSLPEEMSEGRRHLRSDIERKRKEIEMRVQEERRLSERELRSHDEKKKDNGNEVKRKDKSEERKKIKDGKNEEKKEKKKDKESRNYDEKKKDKGGDEKKVKKRKRDKEGRCQEEKRKEKDDTDEKRKDKETKEERNREMKREVDNKRKREGEEKEKRKREKREEIKEKVLDKRERNEEVCEKMMSGEATAATTSEPAPSPTSTSRLSPSSVQPSSASDLPQSTTPADECSVSTSAADSTTALISSSTSALSSASEQSSEPTSTTTEHEQKTEESVVEAEETPVSSEPTSSRERRATPPKDNESKEVQLQISESGVMSMSPVVENPEDIVKTVEERVCVRVTRRSSITGATFRDEGLGNREMRKRGWNSKSDEGSPVDPKRRGTPKSSKIYKTIRRSPNVWHPSIPKEKLRPTLMSNTEETKKPAKFFKLRNRSRLLENPSSDAKPVQGDPANEEDEEEEELPQHEIEKEETQVEPESAQVAKRDEVEEKKMEEDKRRVEEEEEKSQNKEEKRRSEEDKAEPTSTSNSTGLKEDPKSFGPLDKEDKYSTIVGASAPDLPNNLKGDPKTFGPLDKQDKCSTMVGASAPDLPTNLKEDPKTFGPLDEEGKRSTMVGANAPELPTNLKGDAKTFGPLDKEDKCSTMVGASAPNLPTNLKGDLKTFGLPDKEERCSKIIGASAPNLLTNPFIPNSNHFLFSDVTLPPNSGNLSKSAESKLDKSAVLGKSVPGSGIGISGIGGTGLGVGGGNGSGGFKNPVPNGGSFSPMCFLDPCRLVYPYQTYPAPDTDPLLRAPHLPPFGNMGGFNPVSGFHASLPPCINNLSSPHQNVQVVSLVSRKKNKDDSTKERINSCDDSLNSNKIEDKDRKKRRREAEAEVAETKATKESKMEMGAEEEDEDDEKIFVPAKRKRDEKESREKENKEENNAGKKEKSKDEKSDKEKDKGDKKTDDEGLG